MRTFLAAVVFQALVLRRLADLHALITVPLFTLALVSIMVAAGRADLAPHAVVAATVIAVWNMALLVSGEVVSGERENGSLEALVAAPGSLTAVVLGRTVTTTVVSLLSLGESVLVAWLVFGVRPEVQHLGVFVSTLVATTVAMVGTATAFAGLFVLARSARTFQNSLSYPFYLLSGAVVPVALLPEWLQPLARVIFLSWATDLIRDCLQRAPVPDAALRVGVVLGLGVAAYLAGLYALSRIVNRVRADGTMGFA
ncbi:ABC transporter permease [Saccharothrix variisporea]|uniref:ABC-2 type transport system permease protein n=1 Tax=Saccharothrix variisporea TaxID=543527 RepID=A0A495X5Z5_9PSEU|nr:ABC transporter permease [Saccharothrix variisporea]RKT69307.1 ABC-2 type transport system permease protein [Saccharothrix variisporea]